MKVSAAEQSQAYQCYPPPVELDKITHKLIKVNLMGVARGAPPEGTETPRSRATRLAAREAASAFNANLADDLQWVRMMPKMMKMTQWKSPLSIVPKDPSTLRTQVERDMEEERCVAQAERNN